MCYLLPLSVIVIVVVLLVTLQVTVTLTLGTKCLCSCFFLFYFSVPLLVVSWLELTCSFSAVACCTAEKRERESERKRERRAKGPANEMKWHTVWAIKNREVIECVCERENRQKEKWITSRETTVTAGEAQAKANGATQQPHPPLRTIVMLRSGEKSEWIGQTEREREREGTSEVKNTRRIRWDTKCNYTGPSARVAGQRRRRERRRRFRGKK